jgi:Cu2+-containing amine oxidase
LPITWAHAIVKASHWVGFALVPFNFFEYNPAMNISQ